MCTRCNKTGTEIEGSFSPRARRHGGGDDLLTTENTGHVVLDETAVVVEENVYNIAVALRAGDAKYFSRREERRVQATAAAEEQ